MMLYVRFDSGTAETRPKLNLPNVVLFPIKVCFFELLKAFNHNFVTCQEMMTFSLITGPIGHEIPKTSSRRGNLSKWNKICSARLVVATWRKNEKSRFKFKLIVSTARSWSWKRSDLPHETLRTNWQTDLVKWSIKLFAQTGQVVKFNWINCFNQSLLGSSSSNYLRDPAASSVAQFSFLETFKIYLENCGNCCFKIWLMFRKKSHNSKK